MFTCHAIGESQISYQWFKDDALVAGTEFLKIINNIKRTDHGLYHCVVKNNVGTKNSSKISLDVRCKLRVALVAAIYLFVNLSSGF